MENRYPTPPRPDQRSSNVFGAQVILAQQANRRAGVPKKGGGGGVFHIDIRGERGGKEDEKLKQRPSEPIELW